MLVNNLAVFEQLNCPDNHIRVAFPKRHRHRVQRSRRKHVVGIEPSQNLSRRNRHTFIDCVTLAFVGFRNQRIDSGIVSSQDIKRLIRAATVNDDILEIRIRLIHNRIDRFLNEFPLIERRRNNRNFWPRCTVRQRFWIIHAAGNVGPLFV